MLDVGSRETRWQGVFIADRRADGLRGCARCQDLPDASANLIESVIRLAADIHEDRFAALDRRDDPRRSDEAFARDDRGMGFRSASKEHEFPHGHELRNGMLPRVDEGVE